MRNTDPKKYKPNKITLKAIKDVLNNRNIQTIKSGDVEKFFESL